MLDQFGDGDEIRVQFNLRGREWNGPQGIRYFNTLEAWRIERTGSASAPAPAASQSTQSSSSADSGPVFTANSTDNDDLPF